MSQSKKGSLAETLTNVAIGYLVSLASQIAIFPMFGIHVAFHDNIAIGLWFTVVSIVRSYVLRRAYNHFGKRSENGA
jgi:uncharacterized membrane protein (DUF485 family)